MKLLLRLLALSAAFLTVALLPAETKPPAPVEKNVPAVTTLGVWHLQIETPQGTGTPTFTFDKQAGETISGQYKGLFGEAPVTGTLKGVEIKFSVKVNAQGQDLVISYSGTIDGDAMKGKVTFGDAGEGAFTGKRQAK